MSPSLKGFALFVWLLERSRRRWRMGGAMPRRILFNKPYGVLSQFTDRGTDTGGTTRPTLSNFIDVPSVYPAGRLDRDSEALLLRTDDGGLQARIPDPPFKLAKTKLAHVEGHSA